MMKENKKRERKEHWTFNNLKQDLSKSLQLMVSRRRIKVRPLMLKV